MTTEDTEGHQRKTKKEEKKSDLPKYQLVKGKAKFARSNLAFPHFRTASCLVDRVPYPSPTLSSPNQTRALQASLIAIRAV